MIISIKQQQQINKLSKKYQLQLVLLFGSVAKGKDRQDSDIDIAILCEKNISFKKYLELIGGFSKIFKKTVDLSNITETNPLLLQQISNECLLLYGNKNDFMRFKLYAFHRYNDYLPFFKMERALNKKLIQQYAHQ